MFINFHFMNLHVSGMTFMSWNLMLDDVFDFWISWWLLHARFSWFKHKLMFELQKRTTNGEILQQDEAVDQIGYVFAK